MELIPSEHFTYNFHLDLIKFYAVNKKVAIFPFLSKRKLSRQKVAFPRSYSKLLEKPDSLTPDQGLFKLHQSVPVLLPVLIGDVKELITISISQ